MNNNYTKANRDLLKKIGDNIRKARAKTDLSQEDLALESELDRTYISSVERGERNISIDNIERLAKALECQVIELLKGENS